MVSGKYRFPNLPLVTRRRQDFPNLWISTIYRPVSHELISIQHHCFHSDVATFVAID